MAENSVTYRYPFEGTYPVTCDYACHANRTPPSKAPGLDFACPSATVIKAAAAGEVIYCHWGSAGGLYVVIRHKDRSCTLYSHLSYAKVGVGQWVTKGQQIGFSGGRKGDPNSGSSTGPHLHWAIWRLGEGYVDPVPFLEGQEANDE